MGFMSGFASVVVDQYNKGTEIDHDKQKIELTEQLRVKDEERTRMAKQREQESEWQTQAEVFAKQVGRPDDPSAINFFLERLRVDNPSTISAQITNDEIIPPSRTATETEVTVRNPDIPVPAAVSGTVPVITDKSDESLLKRKFGETEPVTKDADTEVKSPETAIIETPVTKEKKVTENLTTPEGWRIVSSEKKFKVPSLGELNWKIAEAQKKGDKATLIDLEYQKKIVTGTLAEQARLDGKTVGSEPAAFLVKKDGKYVYSTLGFVRDNGDGTFSNTASDTDNNTINPDQPLIPLDEDTLKYIRDTDKTFGSKTADYRVQAATYTSALVSVAQLGQVLDVDENALTTASRLAASADDVMNEITSGLSLIDAQLAEDTKSNMSAVLNAKKAYEENKTPENLRAVEQAANQLVFQTQNAMAKGVQNSAANSRLAQAMKTGIIYQLAASNGETAKTLSNLDVQRYESMFANAKNKEMLYANMSAAFGPLKTKLTGVRDSFAEEAKKASSYLPSYNGQPIDYGFAPPRLDEIVQNSLASMSPEMQKATLEFNSVVNKGPQALPTGINNNPNQAEQPQTPQTQELGEEVTLQGTSRKARVNQIIPLAGKRYKVRPDGRLEPVQ